MWQASIARLRGDAADRKHLECTGGILQTTSYKSGGTGVKLRTAVVGILLSVVIGSAFAKPTFRAEVQDDTIIVYSSADKDQPCYTEVTFSFKTADGRVTRRFVCNTFARGQKDFRFCERKDPAFIELKLEGPVTGTCG